MTKEKLLEWIPEFNLVKDEDLREKCINCWIEALEIYGWDEVPKELHPLCPPMTSDDCPEDNIDHVRRVTNLCKMAYDYLHEYADEKGKGLNEDILIAGALMHDVGKYTEFIYKDGKVIENMPLAAMFRHPVSGAYLAKKHGIPNEVVYCILAHSDQYSPEGGNAYLTEESFLVKRMDFTVFKMCQMAYPPDKK